MASTSGALLTRATAQHAPVLTPSTLRTNEAWRLAGISALWLTSLFVVAIWVSGGGLQTLAMGVSGTWDDIRFTAAALTSLGRLCGLVASNLLLYQVLLMARVPLFERAFGHDALTQAHRITGFWSFWLMLAHIVLVVVGYAGTVHTGYLAELWTMITTFHDMLPATLGTLGLIVMVALSIRRARRKVRYETWHFLHLYAYAGIFLALPHQLSTGADFMTSPLATGYWWALWLAAAACTIVFRVLTPLRRSLRHRLVVQSVTPEGTRGATVVMKGRNLRRLRTEPGQFFIWHFLDGAGLPVGHPFSISARPDATHLAITVRIVGDGTRRIASMKKGTRVFIEGPYGHMTPDVRRGRRLLMIGAGAGVAPLVSLLESMHYGRGDATLITRESRAEEALLTRPIRNLVASRGLVHLPLVGPRARNTSPWLPRSLEIVDGPAYLRSQIRNFADHDVYLCGPGPWMNAVRADLARLDIPRERIHFENFSI